MSVLAVNSSSVNLSWVELPCVEKNGEITGYLINYTSTSADDDESGEIMAQADTSSTIVTDLSACIAYNFRVAAMNINGTGPFSHAIHMSTITPGVFIQLYRTLYIIVHGIVLCQFQVL